MTPKKSVAKNTASMMLASVGQKIISLTYFTIIARTLGAELTGMYTAALAMTTIFVVFVDLGFTNVFIREAAKQRDKLQSYLSNVLFAKIFFGILSYAAMAITLQLLGFDKEFQMLVFLSGVTMLFDSLHLSIYGALRAIGNLLYESVALVGSQLITLVLGTTFLFFNLPLIFLIAAFTIASACNVLYASIVAYRVYGLHIRPQYTATVFKHIGNIAIPFAFAAIFGRIYSYVDVILLKKLATDLEVGLYSTPSKISFAFQFIPLALIAALYPRFSEYYAHNRERLARVFEQSMKFLLVIAVPISVGMFVLAEDIIIFVFSDKFAGSIAPLKILVISLAFSFLSFPIGAFLNACNKQTMQTIITGFVLVVNVVANMMLIPAFGAVGAAYAALVGNICLAVLGYLVIPWIARISHAYVATIALQVGISALCMGLLVWYANRYMHFLLTIVIGAVVYALFLFLTKALNKQQLSELVALVRR